MREAHSLERTVGIGYYVSDADGTGGVLRTDPADFQVREIERIDPEPIDADPGAYPHVLLRVTLRGWDTNDFAGRLSNALGASRERISWAGTKDKHAITTQLFSVKGVDPDEIPEIRDADVAAVGRLGRSLTFGDLAGNEFGIRVRDVERPGNVPPITAALRTFGGADGDEIGATGGETDGARAAETDETDGTDGTDGTDVIDGTNGADPPGGGTEATARIGVPNYFGHQRFGSRRPVTHRVGLHVVRGEWREAVLAYVGNPHDAEPEETREARAFADEEAASDDPDWRAVLERMPRYLGYERSMLHRLVEGDAAEAGGADARGSPDDGATDGGEGGVYRRALEAVPTNLQRLFVNAAQSFAFNRILTERMARGLPFDRPVSGDVVCFADRDAPADLAVPAPDADRTQRVTERRVDVVTRHCARERAFVTAPLIGTDTELADGRAGEIEREVLADLGLEPADFDLPGEFRSSGTRRPILVRTDVAAASDGDELRFSFSLPHGSYATVVMREYLKREPHDL